ncbi:MAG TPA: GAF domain-containing protein, partial [Bacillota bacterium]|nr:GAF domain-containing protein [Bacillota bacterium]
MNKAHMAKFLDICLAISSERDRESLLSAILDTAMELNRCDAGTLYLLEDDGLHFCRMVTKSQNVRQGGHDAPISLPPVPLQDNYIAAYAVMHGCSVRIDDVRADNRFDFSGA